jgi:hypothetical protein
MKPLALIASTVAQNYFLGLHLIKTKSLRIYVFTSDKKKIVARTPLKSMGSYATALGSRLLYLGLVS